MLLQVAEPLQHDKLLALRGWRGNVFVLEYPGLVMGDEAGVESGGQGGIDV